MRAFALLIVVAVLSVLGFLVNAAESLGARLAGGF